MEKVALMGDSKHVPVVDEGQFSEIHIPKTYTFTYNIILALALVAVSIKILHKEFYSKAFFDTVSTVTLFIVTFATIEICMRIYHLIIELCQVKRKYEGDVGKVFEALNLNTASWLVTAFSIAVFLVLHITVGNTIQYLWSLGPLVLIPSFVCSIIVCQMIGLRDSKLATSELIRYLGGVDYGTGMAFSYFYGYLKIILPADEHNKGLRFKMEQYEGLQNVTIPVKKLFILIPTSGHIPPNLKEASYDWMESTSVRSVLRVKEPPMILYDSQYDMHCQSLEIEVIDRAGVKRRQYRNTVYKIFPGGNEKHRPVYVTAEGATPMLTLWEIVKHVHPQTAVYREHWDQIINAFYETLESLLDNDPRCRDVCELVFYKDRDAKGKLINVGDILLKKIRHQAANSV